MAESPYPDIDDYGYIADCHSQALVSRHGSIDWCCMPRADSPPCFGRLLDWRQGGYCLIAPTAAYECSRRYLDNTLIIETTFTTGTGKARLLDCFAMNADGLEPPHQQILRVVEGVAGQVEFGLELVPRFDYGAIKPWIRQIAPGHFQALGGSDGLLISGDLPCETKGRHALTGSCTLRAGERLRLSILYREPEQLQAGLVQAPQADELDRRLARTRRWWQDWCSRGNISGPYRQQLQRSAITLKGLWNSRTGALAAAATTSLPEVPGGLRNWDYRFTWIRDSAFTMRSLAELGYSEEADAFRRFIERSAGGSAEELQVLYGMGGERRLQEFEIEGLEGYRGAKPVRVGNAAYQQHQIDLYGWLLHLAWAWHSRGHTPNEDYWEFLVELADRAARDWQSPGQGFWEMRGIARHFVVSKAMCWLALDCAIKLARDTGRTEPLHRWQQSREEIRRAIEQHGYDAKRGVFVMTFDYPAMDSSLLLLPITGLVDFTDERMVRTTDALREDLEEDGLLHRYPAGSDGMQGQEGVFIACSFWLAECLARQGRVREARAVFERALNTGNDLGLYSEEYDLAHKTLLGNFPQALTHLSLIAAGVALEEMAGKAAS